MKTASSSESFRTATAPHGHWRCGPQRPAHCHFSPPLGLSWGDQLERPLFAELGPVPGAVAAATVLVLVAGPGPELGTVLATVPALELAAVSETGSEALAEPEQQAVDDRERTFAEIASADSYGLRSEGSSTRSDSDAARGHWTAAVAAKEGQWRASC